MRFGQLVIGGAGSGKSTYVLGVSDLLNQLKRDPVLVNLDCGNGTPPFKADIDIRDLIDMDTISSSYDLGPNGALLFSIDQLLIDFDWLKGEILKCGKDRYFVFDLPGQVELFTHSSLIARLVHRLVKECDFQFVIVHMTDSFLCIDRFSYLSALLLGLSSAARLELPFLGVLSKIDLMKGFKDDLAVSMRSALLTFGEGSSMTIAEALFPENKYSDQVCHPLEKKYAKLPIALCELVEEYGTGAMLPLAVEDKELMLRVLAACDKANGYSANRKDGLSLPEDRGSLEEYLGELEEKFLYDISEQGICGACRSPGALTRCGRCKKVSYCDRECQAEHWKVSHRTNCIKADPE